MKLQTTPLKDCFIIELPVFTDERGTFIETFHKEKFFQATGLAIDFIQDNQSVSKYGVLRGLHFQEGNAAQAKLVRVVQGEVLDVVVDLRQDSPSFGQHFSIRLSAKNNKQLFIPRGFAHGFVSLAENTIFTYKCDILYNPQAEAGIHYADATLNIDWHLPKEELIISDKDKILASFKDYING